MKRVLKKSKVISLTGKMSRSDKRVAARLRAPQCSAQTHLMRCRGAPMCAPAGSPLCHLDQVKRSGTRGEIPQCSAQTFSSAKAFSLAEKVGNSPANCSDKGFVAQATKNAAVATAAFQPLFLAFSSLYTKANASIYKNSRK